MGGQVAPWWLTIQLWGLDAPVAALCWGLAFATLMDIPMITSGPLLLLAASVWLITIATRLDRAVRRNQGWYMRFYRSNLVPMALLTVSVAAASLWMLFFHVGQILILYTYKPFLLLLLGSLPWLNHVEPLRGFFLSVAFALACAAPAAFFSVLVSPSELWNFAPVWYLAILIFLYYLVRTSWHMEEDAARKRGLIVSVGLVLLFLFCLLSAGSAPSIERSLCLTIAIGAACLELLVRLRPRLSQDALFSLGWLAMTLPPVLGLLIF